MKALEGLRIVDFGIITAGASTSSILADLGAEVIKVEGPAYMDPFRHWQGAGAEDGWWNTSPHFHFTNRNKKSLCVDLKSPKGRDLVLDLVRVSDIVIENFRVGVLDRLGLGFDALSAANERIVLGSISSQGITGPDAGAVSFGSTLEASSGFADLIRYDGGDPHISGQALNYPDQVVSLFAAGMVMSAVLEARRTGSACHVDISQREVTAFLMGERIVAAAHGIEAPASVGAPATGQGIFPSRDGRWVAVTVAGDTAAGPDCLAQLITERSADDAVAHLRSLGAAAHVALKAADFADPDAASSGLAFASDPGGRPVKGLPWSRDGETVDIRCPAPTLGQDNRSVVCDLLGRDEAAYGALVAEGVLTERPR